MDVQEIQHAAKEQLIELIRVVTESEKQSHWQLRLGLERIMNSTERQLRPTWLAPQDSLSMVGAKHVMLKAWAETMNYMFPDEDERARMDIELRLLLSSSQDLQPLTVDGYLNVIAAGLRSNRAA